MKPYKRLCINIRGEEGRRRMWEGDEDDFVLNSLPTFVTCHICTSGHKEICADFLDRPNNGSNLKGEDHGFDDEDFTIHSWRARIPSPRKNQ